MKSFFKNFTIVATILSSLVFHNAAYALVSQADIEAVNKGGEFYQQGCNTNQASNGEANLQLSMVGDSLLVGAYSAGLNGKVNAKGYVLSDPENQWPSGKVSRNTQGGIEIIKANSLPIKNSGAIVIELGTNDKLGLIQNNGERIDQVIQAVKDTQTTAKVYWIIPYNTTLSATDNTSVANMLNSKAQSLQFTTLDWPNEVKKNNYALEGGVHPGANYAEYADFIVNNVTNTSKGLSIQGSCRCNSLTGDGTLPDSVPQPYHDIFIAAASQFNVEPATLVALKFKETSSSYPEISPDGSGGTWGFRTEVVGGAWQAQYLAPGSPNVGRTGSAGPFQFLFSTWKSQTEAINNDGNKDGRYDAENVIDAAYGAARFISELGATKGASEEAMILAFTKYNAGPGTNSPTEYGRSAYKIYQDVITQGGSSIQGTGGSTTCNKGQGVSPDGFQFPLNTTKTLLKKGNPQGLVWDCAKNAEACLADPTYFGHGYAAADIGINTGTPVLAARPGQVVTGKGRACPGSCGMTIQGEDGLFYYYGHMKGGSIKVDKGQKVNAGDVIGEVGTTADAENTSPHLHFDVRSTGGITCVRSNIDPRCAEIMKDPRPALIASYNNLPEE
jgi:murein DD-endopeptidase MepM/ murein hydrolase activator NlpD